MTDQWVPAPPPDAPPPNNGITLADSWNTVAGCSLDSNVGIVEGVIITGVPAVIGAVFNNAYVWTITLNDGQSPPNFSIDHYDSAGNLIDSPIVISGLNGYTQFNDPVLLSRDPQQPMEAATKEYVDANVSPSGVNSWNSRQGDVTMTSNDVLLALGYSPYNAANPAGYQDAAQVQSAINFAVPQPSNNNPNMDGVVAPGMANQWSRWDHIHPSDTSKIGDAPNDGNQYARQNQSWAHITIPPAGIGEAPTDGQQYARQNAAWTPFVSGPPTTISATPPTNPSVGQLWWDSVGGQLYVWYNDGNSSQWVIAVNAGNASITTAASPPVSPALGAMWWDTVGGQLYIWYNDGNSAQWVPATNQLSTAALPLTGGTMSGPLMLAADPVAPLGAVTKQMADQKIVSVKVQTFSASGTYTPSAGMAYCLIELVGGGGGGGGTLNPASGLICMGGGAGSGGYSRRLVTAAQVGASQVVTIGAGGAGGAAAASAVGGTGGNTSVGSLCVANGSPGAAAMGSSVANYVLNGTPGANTTGAVGDLVVPGNAGASGVGFGTVPIAASGTGGASFFGGGGPGRTAANSAVAGAAGVMGSGGGGAASANFTTNGAAGGAGGAGYVIITEYCTV